MRKGSFGQRYADSQVSVSRDLATMWNQLGSTMRTGSHSIAPFYKIVKGLGFSGCRACRPICDIYGRRRITWFKPCDPWTEYVVVAWYIHRKCLGPRPDWDKALDVEWRIPIKFLVEQTSAKQTSNPLGYSTDPAIEAEISGACRRTAKATVRLGLVNHDLLNHALRMQSCDLTFRWAIACLGA